MNTSGAALAAAEVGRRKEARLAVTSAEDALERGDTDAALAVLTDALSRHPALPRLRRLARELFLVLSAGRRLPEAHKTFALLHEPPEQLRLRHAVALLEAGMIDAAAEVAAGLSGDETRTRLAGRVLRAAAERPEAIRVLLALVGRGSFSGARLRMVCGALAQAGEAAAARALFARATFADPAEAALCEATLLHAEGRLEEARQRIAAVAAAAVAGAPAVVVAQRWAREALDFDAAADLAQRALPPDPDMVSPQMCLGIAKLLAEHGRHEAAWDAVRRAKDATAALQRPPGMLSQAERTQAAQAALSFADLAAAVSLSETLPAQSKVRQNVRAVAWACGSHPPSRLFLERAARAWADPDAALEEALAADIAIICPAGMRPCTGLGRWTDGTAPPVGEEGVCHRVLVRTMELAEQAGLAVAMVPSPGFAVPPALIARRRFFVSYHSVSAEGFGVHVKAGPLPDTLLLDPTGYSGWASICARRLEQLPLDGIPYAEAAEWQKREVARVASSNISKWEQRPRTAAAALPAGPAVLVALQIPSDNAMRHAWVDMYDFARAVVRGFRGRGVTVLLKRHPRCRDPRTDRLLRDLRPEPGVAVTDASVHDLLPSVRAVYCVNSGLGAEALLYGRAVHLAGLTDYRHGCHEVRRLDDLRTDESAFAPPLSPDALCRYVYWYRNIYHVPLDRPGALDEAIRTRILEPAAASAR